jgi:hypothetical protein
MERWCLWLVGIQPEELRSLPPVAERVALVRRDRLASGKARTREWADQPTLFSEIRQPTSRYLAIPKVSSERRRYLPIGFLEPEVIATGSLQVISDASNFHFGVLHSAMHMAWMRYTCGRMKSDYQYSNSIVYNNFPWPELLASTATTSQVVIPAKAGIHLDCGVEAKMDSGLRRNDEQKTVRQIPAVSAETDRHVVAIETAAQAVLDARAAFPGSTLADLYDPVTTPSVSRSCSSATRRSPRCCRPPSRVDTRSGTSGSKHDSCRFQPRNIRRWGSLRSPQPTR